MSKDVYTFVFVDTARSIEERASEAFGTRETYMAAYKREHGSSTVWLASQLRTSRHHAAHLLDPSNRNYARYPISEDLLRRVARFLRRRYADVAENFAAAASGGDSE